MTAASSCCKGTIRMAARPPATSSAARALPRAMSFPAMRPTGSGFMARPRPTISIQGNYIGTDQTGTSAQAKLGRRHRDLPEAAHGNTIGGTTSSARNVISGNANQAVFIGDSGTNNNVVQGNYIGLNAAGTAALQNGSGIEITNSAQSNTIGGTGAGAGNVISGKSIRRHRHRPQREQQPRRREYRRA